jgi:predicted O-methyltransferase YrrM
LSGLNADVVAVEQLVQRHSKNPGMLGCRASPGRVERMRRRERFLSRLLSPQLVRRLDRGLSRSRTIDEETAQALYTLCRCFEAQNVFETGTYWGYSTAYLASALRDNGACGKVWTFDTYPHAGKHIPPDLRRHIVLCRGKPASEMMPSVLERVAPDVFFQDSRHDYEGVAEELRIVAPALQTGGLVVFHDFALRDVRQAACETLQGFLHYTLDLRDPRQLGVAIKAY